LTVSRKRDPVKFDYEINNATLKYVTQEKVGVIVSSDLKWDNHIGSVVAKGYRMLGFLDALSLARPHVGYASEVWAPQFISNISKVVVLGC
jgi:hypothetical protein